MNLLSALMTPLALLVTAPGTADGADVANHGADRVRVEAAAPEAQSEEPARVASEAAPQGYDHWLVIFASRRFEPEPARQVRMEESVTIRIAPRPRAQAPEVHPNMLVGVPDRALGSRFVERRMGKCLPVKGIAGVQPGGGGDLILFLRDRRIVRAELERSCRARDYYSGFYLSRSSDGRLCVDRDALQSRSGANCKLTRIRQLVEAGD